MHQLTLELVIRHKLKTGALPRNSIPRVWGGPGNGETCDGCESIITKDEWVIEGISLAEGRKPLQLHAECFHLWERERHAGVDETKTPVWPKTTGPMADKGGPAPDREGPEGNSFTIAGRVTHWDPIERALTIGGRVLSVAASVFFVGNLVAGVTIIASGHEAPDSGGRWVVMQLRVD